MADTRKPALARTASTSRASSPTALTIAARRTLASSHARASPLRAPRQTASHLAADPGSPSGVTMDGSRRLAIRWVLGRVAVGGGVRGA